MSVSDRTQVPDLTDVSHATQVAIVGGGFTGLAAAYELAKRGIKVTVLEAETEIGGLASAFKVGGTRLDRFYHHWFTSDLDVMGVIEELGVADQVAINPTNTGVYYANRIFRLSTPWDLLNFSALGVVDRIRLGLLALRARRVAHWEQLESKTASEWLRELGGEKVFEVVWRPLLKGKFGPYADDVSAVWFWNKLKLRGGSRGKAGEERLAYFKGGFVSLADAMAKRIRELGGRIETGAPVSALRRDGANWRTETAKGVVTSPHVIATTALPLVADMIREWAEPTYVASLEKIDYIGNVCLVLELSRSLSNTYWLNVNDPSFPFVGVIEHTNFEGPANYGGRHIVYLSKYLPHTDALYRMDADGFLDYALPFLQKMFPDFDRSWILAHHIWRARWSQPVVGKYYSRLIPSQDGPAPGFHICSMAQIYPEDRGTNYAIREGRKIARRLAERIEPRSTVDSQGRDPSPAIASSDQT
ncbi:NAD(P)/FAD-dependent oxidoreductase [uncultured Rhodoblastus sp.]|uniref:NAD(P)/FAD-dependent oxidoreductase n=1 Tax=uncultured Rhodoblastus sp. TaxID=543037 RepID=UPI0025F1D5D4|nr:NAD(P)/FAD-dependent oxidoreductase [uncultured Rhodoblastus sp.]